MMNEEWGMMNFLLLSGGWERVLVSAGSPVYNSGALAGGGPPFLRK